MVLSGKGSGGSVETVTGSIPAYSTWLKYTISYTDANCDYISGVPNSETITVLKNTIVAFGGNASVMDEYDFGGLVVDASAALPTGNGGYIKLATVTGDFTISSA